MAIKSNENNLNMWGRWKTPKQKPKWKYPTPDIEQLMTSCGIIIYHIKSTLSLHIYVYIYVKYLFICIYLYMYVSASFSF